jgi:DNA-binding transcriptional ArsR family regulator
MKSDYTQTIPPEWQAMSKIFVALGDEHRQRILLLFEPGERLNVGQIAEVSTLARSTVSHHLKILHDSGVAGFREDRQGGLVLDRPAGAGNHLYQCPRLSEGKLLMRAPCCGRCCAAWPGCCSRRSPVGRLISGTSACWLSPTTSPFSMACCLACSCLSTRFSSSIQPSPRTFSSASCCRRSIIWPSIRPARWP